ncbi:MAG: hypothetical protein J3Q66DRAFT_421306 [Benniella sp.]|nr:MAG: hypothetical protein J3Q66DRAFT_421306 [Benniella sp.]
MPQSHSNIKGAFHVLTRILVLLLGTSLITFVHAQSDMVECTFQSTYTSLEGRGLYIQSGITMSKGLTTQAFMIDLSKSWTIDSPSIKKLASGTGWNYFPSGISSDGKNWYTLKNDRGEFYDSTTNTWKEKFRLYIQGAFGLTGATDHANDMLYIPFAFPNANRRIAMLRINLKNGDTQSDDRPFSLSKQSLYATAWNPLRKSLIYVGTSGVFEYTWENGWKPFFTKGLDTISPSGSCLVSVSGGKKMALYGGMTQDRKDTTADLYILNLSKKGKEGWTKVPMDPKQKSLYSRKEAACGSSGDQIIIWGGTATSGDYLDTSLIIFLTRQGIHVMNIMVRSLSNTKDAPRLLTRVMVFFLAASLILSAHAQSDKLDCVFHPTYTSLEGRGLYIQSGLVADKQAHYSNQTFMIDLSKSWNANNPSIKRLADGYLSNYFPSGISSDGKSWYVLKGDQGVLYNTTANTWTEKFRLYIQGAASLTGATDQANDMLYIPFAFPNANRRIAMLRINLRNGDTDSDNRPFSLSVQNRYATAWNPLRKSLIYVGTSGVFEYTWEKGWKPFFNKGLDTIHLYGSCLVSVSGGKKMALYGGVTQDDKGTTADLYILELSKKGKEGWTKVPVDAKKKSLYSRKGAACGSSNDQVIIWGGSATTGLDKPVCPSQRTIVFNTKTMKWTDRYVASK